MVVGSSAGLSGCGAGSSSVSPNPGLAPSVSAAAKKALSPSGTQAADKGKMVSNIAGDRLTIIPSTVVLTKQTESSPFRFAEIAREAGIDFVHFSGMTDDKHFPTAIGSGVAFFV
jgi:hypothetical protein